MDIINPVLYEVMFANEAVPCPVGMIASNPIRDAVPDGRAWKKILSRKALSADHTCMPVMFLSHKSPVDCIEIRLI
jgi:hypothetical protein